MDKLRVIVADDSEFMRVAYKRILETQEHLEIVGMAADGEEAVSQAEATKPQVAILDVRMPKLNGIEAASQILAKQPQTGIVIISAYDDPEYVLELLKHGTQGKAYLLKTSIDDIEELINAVQTVATGGTVLDPAIVQRLVDSYLVQPGSPFAQLSESEQEVLSLMTDGYSEVTSGEMLGLDQTTTEEHISSIYARFNLHASAGYDSLVVAIVSAVIDISKSR